MVGFPTFTRLVLGSTGATLVACVPDRDKDSEEASDSNGDSMGDEDNGLSRNSMSHSLAGKQSMQVLVSSLFILSRL